MPAVKVLREKPRHNQRGFAFPQGGPGPEFDSHEVHHRLQKPRPLLLSQPRLNSKPRLNHRNLSGDVGLTGQEHGAHHSSAAAQAMIGRETVPLLRKPSERHLLPSSRAAGPLADLKVTITERYPESILAQAHPPGFQGFVALREVTNRTLQILHCFQALPYEIPCANCSFLAMFNPICKRASARDGSTTGHLPGNAKTSPFKSAP